MTHTRRMFLYLVLVALAPPVLMLAALWQQQRRLDREMAVRRAVEGLDAYARLRAFLSSEIGDALKRTAESEWIQSVLVSAAAGRPLRTVPTSGGALLDFVEVCDSSGVVVASRTRPGLVGRRLTIPPEADTVAMWRGEYDARGRRGTLARRLPLPGGYQLYGGRYLDSSLRSLLAVVTGADIRIFRDTLAVSQRQQHAATSRRLYLLDGEYRSDLENDTSSGLVLTAVFPSTPPTAPATRFLVVTALAGLAGVGLALGLGFRMAARTRREVDNLVKATARVAGGDFSTPVMAYEEGEFAQLADSISEMMRQLTEGRRRLAAAQQVAAWEQVGRRIAHELKNPLSPIAVAADDIRHSLEENHPGLADIVRTNTRLIRDEVRRLTALLDGFVAFARMAPPRPVPCTMADIRRHVLGLFPEAVTSGRVQFDDQTGNRTLRVDPDQMKQVLINLIKNALETGEETAVTVISRIQDNRLVITVEDTGPGFSPERLAHPFEPQVSGKPGGSGVGLLICRRIVLDHGGELTIVNRPDRGAHIELAIPVD